MYSFFLIFYSNPLNFQIQTESNRALKAIKQAQKIVDGSLKTINTSLIAYQQEVTEALSTLNSGHEHFVAVGT